MASVRKVATKRGSVWQARWRERGRARAMNFASKRAADDCARRMGELVERRGVGDAERLSTGAYLVRFVAEIEASNEYSPATVTAYRKMTAIVSRVFGTVALSRLTTAAIEDGYAALLTRRPKPLTRGTVRFLHRVLVLALNRAVRRGLIAVNPAINAAPATNRKADERRIKVFSPEEVASLLAAAKQDARPDTLAIVMLLLATGLRRAEVLGITTEDVDIDNGRLHVRGTVIEVNGRPVARDRGKSAAALRTLALPPAVVALLRAQRSRVQEAMLRAGIRSPAYLFPDVPGQPMPPPRLTARLKRLMRAAGISDRAPCHTWRHTSGSLIFDDTGNAKLVQTRLGHADVRTTMGIYVHSLASREREVAAFFERMLTQNKT
jgi:integrase